MGLLETLHQERKARLNRIKLAAIPEQVILPPPPPPPEPIVVVEEVEEVFVNRGSNTFEIILFEICEYYKVRQEDILSARRLFSIAEKRQILIYMLYLMTKLTNPQIGKKLNRDPTSIGYAIHKIRHNIDRYKADILALETRIRLVLALREKGHA